MHRTLRIGTAALVVFVAEGLASPARAGDSLCSQLSNLVSRPTVSTTACAVGDGALMVETGLTNQNAPGSNGSETLTYPQSTVRAGLGHGLEYVVVPPSFQRVSQQPALSGDTDGTLGAKFQTVNSARIASALGAAYTLGTGTPGLEASGEGLTLTLDTDYTISPALGFFSTIGYVSLAAGASPAGGGRTNAFLPSAGLSLGVRSNVSLFAEGYGHTSSGPGSTGQYGLDGGVSYDAGTRLQFDANLFDTIGSSGGRSHAVGFGAAYLFGAAP